MSTRHRVRTAAEVRDRIDHPIVDADGHTLEFRPALDEYLMTEGALVRVPKGFESAPATVQVDLRLKSWAVSQSIPLRTARSPELVEAIAGLALSCADLLEFGWTSLEAA